MTSHASGTASEDNLEAGKQGDSKKDDFVSLWRATLLWGAVLVVVAATTMIIILFVHSHSGQAVARDSSDVQLLAITNRPQGDTRRYQHAVLPNGLQVVNVLNENSLTAAYSMTVKAGSFDDPADLPGLAHFCEHMLFLGTAGHPDATDYYRFVTSHGGHFSSRTAEETTTYYTELSKGATDEGLVRFADLFSAPLFSKESVEQEVHAIDSEHRKNMQDPALRMFDAMSSLANPKSPVSAFHTGNIDTLHDIPGEKGIDMVNALKHWNQNHYCAMKMHLVTIGSEPLDTQLDRAYKAFKHIPSGSAFCQAERSWKLPLAWSGNSTANWVTIQGTQSEAQLVVFFALEDLSSMYASQPLQYVNYLLTYGGENSLSVVLRDSLGLVHSLDTFANTTSAGTSLWVQFRLTRLGRKHPELVLDVLFGYLTTVQRSGVDEDLYTSLANVSQLTWHWGETKAHAEVASDLSEKMTRLPPANLLSGDGLIEEVDPEAVSKVLQSLQPRRMNVGLVDRGAGTHPDWQDRLRTTPYYFTKYTVKPLEDVLPGAVERWNDWRKMKQPEVQQHVSDRIRSAGIRSGSVPVPVPPARIPGLSSPLSLDHMHAEERNGSSIDLPLWGPPPETIKVSWDTMQEAMRGTKQRRQGAIGVADSAAVWYRSGWIVASPKVRIRLDLRPLVASALLWEMDALPSLRLSIFTSLLAEDLAKKLYDRTVPGAEFKVVISGRGLSFFFHGFPMLLPSLVDDVIDGFLKGVNTSDSSQYQRLYSQLDESYRDYSGMPIDYAIQDRNVLLTTSSYSQEESLEALWKMQPQDVENAPKSLVLFQPLHLRGLVMGNIDRSGSERITAQVVEGLSDVLTSTTGNSDDVQRVEPVAKPDRPLELRRENPRPGDTNDAVVLTIITGVATVQSRVVNGILGQILRDVAHDYLRTGRQLGYVVSAGMSEISNVQYFSTELQGSTSRADDMEAAVEYVHYVLMPKHLRQLTTETFDAYKDSFMKELLQPPAGSSEEFDHAWERTSYDGSCFGLMDYMLDYLKNELKGKDQLIQAWDQAMFPQGSSQLRQKISVKLFAGKVPPRPEADMFRKLLQDVGVSGQSLELLAMEYNRTQLLDAANSTVRRQLAERGGYYPSEVNCEPPERKLPQAHVSRRHGGHHFLSPV